MCVDKTIPIWQLSSLYLLRMRDKTNLILEK